MDISLILLAALVIGGFAILVIVMWPRRPLPNADRDAQRLTEAPIKRPPD